MAALPYMQLYVADYLSDTMHLTAEEHGAYLLLIFNYWQTGKPLPNDDKRLCNIARVSSDRWTDVKESLIEYFVLVDEVLMHPRIEADLKFVEDKQNKASEAGKASAKARKKKKQDKLNVRSLSGSTDVTTDDGTDVSTDSQLESNHTDSESYKDSKPDKRFSAIKMRPDFFPEKDWKDIIEQRKKKRAANTERAYESIIKELDIAVNKLGFTPDQIVNKWTNRGWAGFEAEWMKGPDKNKTPKPSTYKQQKDSEKEDIARLLNAESGNDNSKEINIRSGEEKLTSPLLSLP